LSEPHLKFYSKPDCPLCDAGLLIVRKLSRRFDFEIDKIDISNDADLAARFGEMIPVVELGDDVLCYGKISERELARAIGDKLSPPGLLRKLGLRR
jgi:thiol-disulfide isomerase/thioredoxin